MKILNFDKLWADKFPNGHPSNDTTEYDITAKSVTRTYQMKSVAARIRYTYTYSIQLRDNANICVGKQRRAPRQSTIENIRSWLYTCIPRENNMVVLSFDSFKYLLYVAASNRLDYIHVKNNFVIRYSTISVYHKMDEDEI